MVYGQEKSEIIPEGGEQMSIFHEAEENANEDVRECEKDVIVPEHMRKSKRTHEETFENLHVEEVLDAVEDKKCPECGEHNQLTERQELLKPILDGLFAWLSELPVSGGAKLARFVDSNCSETAIRPFVVGRKNWLFANSVRGAQASAIIYSLAATATANGLNVEEYFTRLCRMERILPWNTDCKRN